MLAVDLDQRAADVAHQRDAGRLVVDEDAGAAVGGLHAAQDDVAVVVERVLGKDGARRMVRGTSKTADTWPCAAPWRTSEASPRAPSASDKASSRMDLPAPVSPVRTERPAEKSMSSRSIRTISRIDRRDSIQVDFSSMIFSKTA